MLTINCTEFERVLQESAEKRVPADSSDLRDHADRCPDCRIQWERYAVLERVIPLWKSRGVDVDLTDVVLARLTAESPSDAVLPLRETPPKRQPAGDLRVGHRGGSDRSNAVPIRPEPSSRRATTAVLAVVVVAMFLAILPLFVPMQQAVQQPRTVTIVQPSASGPGNVTPHVPREAGLTDLFRDAGSAYSGLAREAADAAGDAVALVPSAVAVRPEMGSASASSHKRSNWTTDWQRPFEPIGHDVSDAIDFLFDKMKTL